MAETAPTNTAEVPYGPRPMSFFTLVMKSFAGFTGGVAGTVVLLLIFLSSSSILQPVLGTATDLQTGEISPLFMVVLMAMIFSASLIASMISTLLLCFTERQRYTRVATVMGQVFIVNIVIFGFVLPVYMTAGATEMQVTAFAAGIQIILSSIASALILELLHDYKYAILSVYSTVLGILIAMGVNFLVYSATGAATILLFISLPVIWGLIGFFQAAITMFYYWMFQTWGTDYLASSTELGKDYGQPPEEEEPQKPDVEGSDFLKQ